VDTVLYLVLKLRASFAISINGWFPIHFAAAVNDHQVLFNILRVEGTDDEINRPCQDGSTPLHIAVGNGQLRAVLILLQEGAPSNAKNLAGNTPLHICARLRSVPITEALLAAGAKLGIQNESKETPLSIAQSSQHKEVWGYFEKISNKTAKRENFRKVVRKYYPELAQDEEDPGDDSARTIGTISSEDSEEADQLQQIQAQLQALQQSVRGFDEMGLFDDLPLDIGKLPETLTPPPGCDPAMGGFCAEINQISGKIAKLKASLKMRAPKEAEVPVPAETQAPEPIQVPYTVAPIPIYGGRVPCSLCGAPAYIFCDVCANRVCRFCHYSKFHTCPRKP
jgi:hypothetical protein